MRLTDQKWPEGHTPVVSVLCPAYNHEETIRHCIDSILSQETTFPVEIIIRDDASTDGTSDIVRRYQESHPNLIKGIFESENQYSKGVYALPVLSRHVRGEYTAICEGDDYWTAPDKLQKQVELLEGNPECSMCVAQTQAIHEHANESKVGRTYYGLDKSFLTFNDFFSGCYVHTSTYVIRAFGEIEKQWSSSIRLSDTSLKYILSDLGPVVFLRETVSVYRITGEGIWTSLTMAEKLSQEINLNESFFRHFKRQYRSRFSKRLLKQYYGGLVVCARQGDARGVCKHFSGYFRHAIRHPLAAIKLITKSAMNCVKKALGISKA